MSKLGNGGKHTGGTDVLHQSFECGLDIRLIQSASDCRKQLSRQEKICLDFVCKYCTVIALELLTR